MTLKVKFMEWLTAMHKETMNLDSRLRDRDKKI